MTTEAINLNLRDHNGYTGDENGTPDGNPLPTGDPTTGPFLPDMANLRAAFGGTEDAAARAEAAAAQLGDVINAVIGLLTLNDGDGGTGSGAMTARVLFQAGGDDVGFVGFDTGASIMRLKSDVGQLRIETVDGNQVQVRVNDTIMLEVTSTGIEMNLPTSDPGGSGLLWNDGGTVKIT